MTRYVIVGSGEAGDPVTHAPGVWFWSDHYDLGLQMTGRFSPDDTIVRREIGNGFLLFALDPSGRLRAAAGIGTGNAVAKDIRFAEMLIGRDACPAPQSLQDPSLSLKTLLRSA
ncbi:Anthranilate 1,2-dioxygenase system ferredoxin-NAD(+) reductase component [Hartmannibacter diazotrophicus]|uniref:Anthranilate 1,2-dioxygenase system ferredoxin-NAD(+) reductase component n=1 Tax=Hartmannibacter diazotrophicus TaxID=1482074 RepID=A0A2C9D606_9HYPH|nr:oxidoreductase C-terminal domain-containing protein [Hartmannibacter diazotrophicus]SON54955.1 Anthranilate 1,2-dioxygenase system ferredoxin-NAD(+) reductase component [Hartmannibacter diazotrophicus]